MGRPHRTLQCGRRCRRYGPKRVEAGDRTLAVFNIEGEFFVTDDLCTHGPGSLSEGYIDGDVVECNFHNGQFNIKTGEVVSPPCMIPARFIRSPSRTARWSSRSTNSDVTL